jgi:hypothetical protein
MAAVPGSVQALQAVCVRALAAAVNAGAVPAAAGRLPAPLEQQVVEQLSLELPLEVAAVMIQEGRYWHRRAAARWSNCDATPHGGSWKQLYMERNLQQAIAE